MPEALYEKHDHYAVFTLNRPEQLNAQTAEMRRLIVEAVEDFNEDSEMRAGIVTGAGRAFSAGRDLKQMAAGNAGSEGGSRAQGGAPWPGGGPPFARSPKPFVAAINGLAVAGGLEVALDCDLRIASHEAYFGLFEPRRGIMAGYAIHHLPRLVGMAAANQMLLAADRVSVEHALSWGLITEIVEPDDLMSRAVELAESIAAGAPLAISGTKAVIQAWRQHGLDDSERVGRWVSRTVWDSDDAKEGPAAFAEKRDPVWKGE